MTWIQLQTSNLAKRQVRGNRQPIFRVVYGWAVIVHLHFMSIGIFNKSIQPEIHQVFF